MDELPPLDRSIPNSDHISKSKERRSHVGQLPQPAYNSWLTDFFRREGKVLPQDPSGASTPAYVRANNSPVSSVMFVIGMLLTVASIGVVTYYNINRGSSNETAVVAALTMPSPDHRLAPPDVALIMPSPDHRLPPLAVALTMPSPDHRLAPPAVALTMPSPDHRLPPLAVALTMPSPDHRLPPLAVALTMPRPDHRLAPPAVTLTMPSPDHRLAPPAVTLTMPRPDHRLPPLAVALTMPSPDRRLAPPAVALTMPSPDHRLPPLAVALTMPSPDHRLAPPAVTLTMPSLDRHQSPSGGTPPALAATPQESAALNDVTFAQLATLPVDATLPAAKTSLYLLLVYTSSSQVERLRMDPSVPMTMRQTTG
jgi:hypothetical protein